MKISKSRLREIIKEEITRKMLVEAATIDDFISAIGKAKKPLNANILKNIVSQFIASDGDKDLFKNKDSIEKIKSAYKKEGGKELDVENIAKEIFTGKMQLQGDVGLAAAAAAQALGLDSSQAGKLKSVMTSIKGKQNPVEAHGTLSSAQKDILSLFALNLILKNKKEKSTATKKLSSAGEK